MERFLIQVFIFTSPFIILLAPPSYVLWQSKENFYKIDNIVASKEKYLIGYAYNENNYRFLKWTYLNLNENKTIWALGSSRILSFRENMFDATFYNAGYTISSINDFRPFLNSIPNDKHPKYIIIGLDQWMFNSSYDALDSSPSPESWQNSFTFYPKPSAYKTFYEDLFAGKYAFISLKQDNAIHKIGLNAIVNNTGFRNDGSMYYGGQIVKLINNDPTASDYNYSDTFDRIKQGNRRFEYSKSANEKALFELEKLLKYFNDHQINVVAFLPPFADKVYDKMNESDDNYGYLKEIYSRIKPIFDKYNYEVYDFSKVSLSNSSDKETIDGFHGGEVTYQRILITMLDSGSILNQVANVKRLKNDLTNKKNSYIIYEN
ncbi:MAG: hypothetical protein HY001_02775 [Candidatus Portnoybacteria bacterium]|nr:hypothetical protein [Candidatus Portnoybacteria bacterium]